MKSLMEGWRKYISEAKNKDGKEQGVDGKACWKGYRHAGTEDGKDKCVPMEEEIETLEEAEYQGKKVTLNDPIRTSDGPKKFKVYVKDGDKVKKVTFGDPDMEIKRDDPKARKSFRARHKCDQKKDKTMAGYWSCWQWRSGAKVDS